MNNQLKMINEFKFIKSFSLAHREMTSFLTTVAETALKRTEQPSVCNNPQSQRSDFF